MAPSNLTNLGSDGGVARNETGSPVPDTRLLLIEIGNSRVKLVPASQNGPLRRGRQVLSTAGITTQGIAATLRGWRFGRAVLCSVVPAATAAVRAALASLDMPPALEIDHRAPLPFSLVGYPRPARLGADRLANVAGALALGGRLPLVAVDAGTATTFDVLDADGVFRGGAISPGPAAFTDYLHERTALLPRLRVRPEPPPPALGRSTRAAMTAATVHGFRGMARGILLAIAGELGVPERRLRVVAAGGAAPWLRGAWRGLFVEDPDLTLRGMLAVAKKSI